MPKSTRILNAVTDQPIAFMSPNVLELTQIYNTMDAMGMMDTSSWWETIDQLGIGSQFRMELDVMARQKSSTHSADSAGDSTFLVKLGIGQMAVKLLPFFRCLLIKCGERGALAVMRVLDAEGVWGSSSLADRRIVVHGKNSETVVVQYFPAMDVPEDTAIFSTGAGDTFVGALLASLIVDITALSSPTALKATIDFAQQAAVLTLGSPHPVSPLLSSIHIHKGIAH